MMKAKKALAAEDEFVKFEFANAKEFKARPTVFSNDGTFWRMRSDYNLGHPGEHIGLWFNIRGLPGAPLRGTFMIGGVEEPNSDATLLITEQFSDDHFAFYVAHKGEIQVDISPGAVSIGTFSASIQDLKVTGSFRSLEHVPTKTTAAHIPSGHLANLVRRLKNS